MKSRILIVDPSSEIRDAVHQALAGPEWELHDAPHAASALSVVPEFRPQVVLAGADMPDISAFLAELQNTQESPVVVMIAAPASRERVIQELRTGAHDYILTPLAAEELRDRLSRAVEHKRALEEVSLQLIQSEKMASLGRLVAGVAHEINTPIGAIYSNSDVLSRCLRSLETLVRNLPEIPQKREIQQLLEVLSNIAEVDCIACERVVEIVKNLKTFARLDEAVRKLVDIHEGLNSTLRLVECDFKNRIRVEKDYGALPPVECYPNQINEVFMNLLVNASEAIEGQGVIKIRTRRDADRVVIAISDNGKGIAPTDLPNIFDPGFTTKGAGVGTGLGLSIVYKIVQAHGGTIQAASDPDHGTAFTVTLPLRASQADGKLEPGRDQPLSERARNMETAA